MKVTDLSLPEEFELLIRQGKFVEQGQFEGNYFGTSLGAIEAVVQSGKICLLNLHVHSINILRQSAAGEFFFTLVGRFDS